MIGSSRPRVLILGLDMGDGGLILGVDRFLDMCRTVVNVTGDLAAAVVVSARAGPGRDDSELRR